MAGPTSRAALKFDELSAMALPRSARSSIIRTTDACRVGISTALTSPWNTVSAITHGMVTVSESTSAASASDCSIDSTCVTTSTRWRSKRSSHTPASGGSRIEGACPAKATSPSRNAESVRRYTSHDVARRVIQEPMSEMPWPMKKRR